MYCKREEYEELVAAGSLWQGSNLNGSYRMSAIYRAPLYSVEGLFGRNESCTLWAEAKYGNNELERGEGGRDVDEIRSRTEQHPPANAE